MKLADPGAVSTLPATTERSEMRSGFSRVPLQNGDEVQSGDQIEVVLTLTTKNTYNYLAFEDLKPAGFEPVELRSGGRFAGGLCAAGDSRDKR